MDSFDAVEYVQNKITKGEFSPIKLKHPKRNKIKERYLANNAYLHKVKE